MSEGQATPASQPRSVAARIGLTLLSLLGPGAGLLRVGRPRSAVLCLVVPLAAIATVWVTYAALDQLSFGIFAALMVVLLSVGIAAYAMALILTWRASRARLATLPWYGRWYSLIGWVILGMIAAQLTVPSIQGYYRNYYIPAESMLPAFRLNDRVVFDMRAPGKIKRGEVVVFDNLGMDFTKRVVAFAGDRVAMKGGHFVLNGVPAKLVPAGSMMTDRGRAAVYRETVGGQVARLVLDLEPDSYADDFDERTVPVGHIFVLGDHRDNSADSRVPQSLGGSGMVPVAAVKGRALFIFWSDFSSRVGMPVR